MLIGKKNSLEKKLNLLLVLCMSWVMSAKAVMCPSTYIVVLVVDKELNDVEWTKTVMCPSTHIVGLGVDMELNDVVEYWSNWRKVDFR